jgi:hypothetical protein
MILNITYAMYAAITVATISLVDFVKPNNNLKSLNSVGLTFGQDNIPKNSIGKKYCSSIELFSKDNLISNIRPYFALSFADESAAYMSIGIYNDIKFGRLKIIPYFGPAFCQKKIGSWNAKEILNFRTGTELSIDLTSNFTIGVGFYHISNAAITGYDNSFGVDIKYIKLCYNF